MKAFDYQRDLYLKGLSGIRSEIPFTWNDLESKTRKNVGEKAESYIFGGAGSGKTMENNRSAFDSDQIIPRMMRGVTAVSMEKSIFGQKLAHPIIASPVGVLEMAHKRGDLALAEACKETETLMVISSQASYSVEAISKVLGDSPRWFQLYWNQKETVTRSFVKRAEACGCSAIVLTVDTGIPGWRTTDLTTGFLPFLVGKGIANYIEDSEFQKLAVETLIERQKGQKITFSLLKNVFQMNRNLPGGFFKNLTSGAAIKNIRCFSEHFPHPFLNWAHIEKLRTWTNLPILVKGIQHPDDVVEAKKHGATGVWISNHGGRQLDGALGSYDALKSIPKDQASDVTCFDSGVRSGADVFKALARGADLVGIGRPYVCGLALNGVAGAVSVFRNIQAELETTLSLSGIDSVHSVDASFLG